MKFKIRFTNILFRSNWFARNQHNVPQWDNMSTCGLLLLLQWDDMSTCGLLLLFQWDDMSTCGLLLLFQ